MKNNNNKKNMFDINEQKIKMNLNKINNNLNIPQVPLYREYPQYYNTNKDNTMIEEMKKVKYQEFLEPNTYNENNVFTEYDDLTKYSIKHIPHKDFESTYYYNTNGNLINDQRLILNNQKIYKSIYNNENYSSRVHDRQRRIASLKGEINRHISNSRGFEHNSKSLKK